jgi:hypothetical protein
MTGSADQDRTNPGDERARYEAPQLIPYGDIRKLTQSGGNTHHDAGASSKKLGA